MELKTVPRFSPNGRFNQASTSPSNENDFQLMGFHPVYVSHRTTSLLVLRDGKVCALAENRLRILSPLTQKSDTPRFFGTGYPKATLTLLPPSFLLVQCSGIELWDIETQNRWCKFPADENNETIDSSATSGLPPSMRSMVDRGKVKAFTAASVSPSKKTMLSVNAEKTTLTLYDLQEGTSRTLLENQPCVESACFIDDTDAAIAVSYQPSKDDSKSLSTAVIRVRDGAVLRTLLPSGTSHLVPFPEYGSSGSRWRFAGVDSRACLTAFVWDSASLKLLATLEGGSERKVAQGTSISEKQRGCLPSADGRLLYTTVVWELSTFTVYSQEQREGPLACAWTPDSSFLVSKLDDTRSNRSLGLLYTPMAPRFRTAYTGTVVLRDRPCTTAAFACNYKRVITITTIERSDDPATVELFDSCTGEKLASTTCPNMSKPLFAKMRPEMQQVFLYEANKGPCLHLSLEGDQLTWLEPFAEEALPAPRVVFAGFGPADGEQKHTVVVGKDTIELYDTTTDPRSPPALIAQAKHILGLLVSVFPSHDGLVWMTQGNISRWNANPSDFALRPDRLHDTYSASPAPADAPPPEAYKPIDLTDPESPDKGGFRLTCDKVIETGKAKASVLCVLTGNHCVVFESDHIAYATTFHIGRLEPLFSSKEVIAINSTILPLPHPLRVCVVTSAGSYIVSVDLDSPGIKGRLQGVQQLDDKHRALCSHYYYGTAIIAAAPAVDRGLAIGLDGTEPSIQSQGVEKSISALKTGFREEHVVDRLFRTPTTRLNAKPLASHPGPKALLSFIAADPQHLGELQAVLAKDNAQLRIDRFFTVRPSFLRTAVDISRDSTVVELALQCIVKGARGTDAIVRSITKDRTASVVAWTLHLGTLSPHFTVDVQLLVDRFPDLAASFLNSLGVIKARTNVGMESQQVRLPGCGFIVIGHDAARHPETLWTDMRESGELAKHEDPNAPGVLVDACVVPLPYVTGCPPVATVRDDMTDAVGSFTFEDGSTFLETLAKAARADLLGSFSVRALIQYRWQTTGSAAFIREALWYLLTLALITALTFVFNTQGLDVEQLLTGVGDGSSDGGSGTDIASVVLLVVLGLMAGMDAVTEVRQSRIVAGYFQDFWNWLDMLNCALVFVVLCTYFGGWEHARAFLAVAVYLRWYGVLYYLQPFQSTGPLVRMILAIVYDMRYFMLVLCISIAAVWTSFRLLLLDDATLPLEELGDPANGLLLTFNMLLLADFDLATFDGEYTVLLRILFVLSMIMTPIVLLNLLIALMSDSYERIQDQADLEFQYLRARILAEQEAWLSPEQRRSADPKLYPRWLHVLVPRGQGAGRVESGEQWQGVLHELKKEGRVGRQALHEKMERLDRAMSDQQKKLDAQVERLLNLQQELSQQLAAQAGPRRRRE